jgi:hypothetical protein
MIPVTRTSASRSDASLRIAYSASAGVSVAKPISWAGAWQRNLSSPALRYVPVLFSMPLRTEALAAIMDIYCAVTSRPQYPAIDASSAAVLARLGRGDKAICVNHFLRFGSKNT